MPITPADAPQRLVDTVARLRTSSEAVLAQGIRWRPARWLTPELAEYAAVIAELAERADPSARSGERIIRRRHVLDVADNAIGLSLAAMVWGHGTRGYGPDRVGNVVQQSGDALRLKLDGLVTAARTGPSEAWDALTGACKLQGIGPAFATKIAYFAAFAEDSRKPRPLIADANTSWAMWELVRLPSSVEVRESYITYVDLAHRWADECGWRPDDVEWALFEIGKNVPRR